MTEASNGAGRRGGLAGRIESLPTWIQIVIGSAVGLAVSLTVTTVMGWHPGAAIGGAIGGAVASMARARTASGPTVPDRPDGS